MGTCRYTYTLHYQAYTMDRTDCVTLPDQVGCAQEEYDRKTFPVLREDGTKATAMLMGNKYGLHTAMVGDPIVKMK